MTNACAKTQSADQSENATRSQRALVFDFDGLIVDTEWVTYEVWRAFYREHDAELTIADWLRAVGHVGNYDPRHHLEALIGKSLDWCVLDEKLNGTIREAVASLSPMPGVRELMIEARAEGWRVGVASNSDRGWVLGGLERLGLVALVDAVRTRDDVVRHKPYPDVYLAVLDAMDADARRSIAFEDSAPGAEAARAAGLHVIAIPNMLTKHQDIPHAHQLYDSIEQFSLPSCQNSDWHCRQIEMS